MWAEEDTCPAAPSLICSLLLDQAKCHPSLPQTLPLRASFSNQLHKVLLQFFIFILTVISPSHSLLSLLSIYKIPSILLPAFILSILTSLPLLLQLPLLPPHFFAQIDESKLLPAQRAGLPISDSCRPLFVVYKVR